MYDADSLDVAGVLAALAVSDIDASIEWTTRLLGRPPDARPMAGLADWGFGPHGTLQLVLDPDRAGGSLVTLHTQDIAAARAQLTKRGIVLDYDDTTSTKVRFGQLSDPDGNAVTLIEPFGTTDAGPARQHERLWTIAGDWSTEGHVVGDDPVPVRGTDVYEVLAGGHFLVHHVDVTVGEQEVRAIEIIGEPAPGGRGFLARSYDDQGNAEVMEVVVDDEGVFRFTGGPEVAAAAQPAGTTTARVRATLRVAPDGQSMTARWERSEDGRIWEAWMDMRFTRKQPPPGRG